MNAQRLPNGHLLIPVRLESPGVLGDGVKEITPDDPDYVEWAADAKPTDTNAAGTTMIYAHGKQKSIKKAFTTAPAWHGWADITKVEEEHRMVYGDASTETPDAQPGIWKGTPYQGDIVAMDAIKAALPDYMQWANLREMHGPNAAGVVVDASVEGNRFPIAAHVVDDQAWRKVISTTYKGFSIGGKCEDAEIVKIEGRPYRRITKLSLTEISLVDRPANPQARITLFKGDIDMADQETEDTATTEETELSKAADPSKAIALLQQLRNDAENDGDMDAADAYTQAIRQVAEAAGIATPATEDEDEDSDLSDDTDAAADGTDDAMQMAAAIAGLSKAGAAISGSNMQLLQQAHDAIAKACGGACCPGMQKDSPMQMAASLAPDDLTKAFSPMFDGLTKALEGLGVDMAAIKKAQGEQASKIDHLERQPAAGAPAQRAVAVEKVLTGAEPQQTAAEPAELDILKAQRETTSDPTVLRWLGTRIAELETKAIYKRA